ncbi:MAG: riboflavin biosynthesis protein RibF, partial [Candidatus Omnitrophica bacterium]|nr:riboflavin biosynthesis protein RibF [Candidatus Omnitrophota bacterium]
QHRINLIKSLGVDDVCVIPFTKKFSRLKPEGFVKTYLIKRLGVREVFVGDDFRFGENRTGDVALFQEMGHRFGFKVHHIDTIKKTRQKISSSWLRESILKGKLYQASRLLGRRVSVSGKVIKGKGLGKRLGFPTANVQIDSGILPANGVYIVQVLLKNRKLWGISNIGLRPSVMSDQSSVLLEVHLLDFSEKIYREKLNIEFVKRIRDEKKFPSLQSLVAQISKDEKSARRYIKSSKT